MHRDFLGTELNVGDYVLFIWYSHFTKAKVIKLNSQKVVVEEVEGDESKMSSKYS